MCFLFVSFKWNPMIHLYANINISYLLFEAYPIHPPEKEEDPWKVDFQEDCGYKTKLAGGVYSVYKNEEDLANNKPINYEVNTISQIKQEQSSL